MSYVKEAYPEISYKNSHSKNSGYKSASYIPLDNYYQYEPVQYILSNQNTLGLGRNSPNITISGIPSLNTAFRGNYEFIREGAFSASKDDFQQVSTFNNSNPDKLFVDSNSSSTYTKETVFYKRYFEPRVVDERSLVFGDYYYQKGLNGSYIGNMSMFSSQAMTSITFPRRNPRIRYTNIDTVTSCLNNTSLAMGIGYYIELFFSESLGLVFPGIFNPLSSPVPVPTKQNSNWSRVLLSSIWQPDFSQTQTPWISWNNQSGSFNMNPRIINGLLGVQGNDVFQFTSYIDISLSVSSNINKGNLRGAFLSSGINPNSSMTFIESNIQLNENQFIVHSIEYMTTTFK